MSIYIFFKISRFITQRQTIAKMEEELERQVNERHSLQKEYKKLVNFLSCFIYLKII